MGGATGGATTGGATTGGASGGTETGGADTGGTGGTLPNGCSSVTAATGTPPSIDDFQDRSGTTVGHGEGGTNSMDWAHLPANDGRVGQWAHGTFLNPNGDLGEESVGQFRVEDGVLRFWCEDGDDANMEQCNTEFDSSKPWRQWASLDVALQPWVESSVSCYDASSFTGVTFKARSASGNDKMWLGILTPDSSPETGEVYRSPQFSIGSSWSTVQIPFSQVKQPGWSTITKQLNPAALLAISFVVRTVEAKAAGVDGADGEILLPYDIEVDDVAFY